MRWSSLPEFRTNSVSLPGSRWKPGRAVRRHWMRGRRASWPLRAGRTRNDSRTNILKRHSPIRSRFIFCRCFWMWTITICGSGTIRCSRPRRSPSASEKWRNCFGEMRYLSLQGCISGEAKIGAGAPPANLARGKFLTFQMVLPAAELRMNYCQVLSAFGGRGGPPHTISIQPLLLVPHHEVYCAGLVGVDGDGFLPRPRFSEDGTLHSMFRQDVIGLFFSSERPAFVPADDLIGSGWNRGEFKSSPLAVDCI